MTNYTLIDTNKSNDISGIIYEVKRVGDVVTKCSLAIKSIGIVIEKDMIDRDNDNDSLADVTVEGLGQAIGLLADRLSDEKDSLLKAVENIQN